MHMLLPLYTSLLVAIYQVDTVASAAAPYEIPPGTDGWCIDPSHVHQDVPGCGRVCSTPNARGVKDQNTWGVDVPCSACPAAEWHGCPKAPCPVNTNFYEGGYGCGEPGSVSYESSDCFDNNLCISTLEEAWARCGDIDDCQYVMKWFDCYHLRETGAWHFPNHLDVETVAYSCPVVFDPPEVNGVSRVGVGQGHCPDGSWQIWPGTPSVALECCKECPGGKSLCTAACWCLCADVQSCSDVNAWNVWSDERYWWQQFGLCGDLEQCTWDSDKKKCMDDVKVLFADNKCGITSHNLGTTFSTPAECVAKAKATEGCGNSVMWSQEYNWAWGCSCCVAGKAYQLPEYGNVLWDVYIAKADPINVFVVDSGHDYCEVGADGCISDGSGRYAHGSKCHFRYMGAAIINAAAEDFDIEESPSCDKDYIQVNGSTKFCGTTFDAQFVNGRMDFDFFADGNGRGQGFKLCATVWEF